MNYGYDARNLELVDLVKTGIIDPVKATKGAIYAATSIAGLILTADVCITEDPVAENPALSLNMVGGMPPM